MNNKIDKAILRRINDVFQKHNGYIYNVFVMMRYKKSRNYELIENTIKEALAKFGFTAHFAKDSFFVASIWENIELYLNNCQYGIAVFEDIEKGDYNPNISIELGYLIAQNKKCLILKEKGMPNLPSNICGHLYRTFDIHHIKDSIKKEIDNWITNDLGIKFNKEIYNIFSKADRISIAYQSILRMLYYADNAQTPHEIERKLGYRGGDSSTHTNLYLTYLKDKLLVKSKAIPGDYSLYSLSHEIRMILPSYI